MTVRLGSSGMPASTRWRGSRCAKRFQVTVGKPDRLMNWSQASTAPSASRFPRSTGLGNGCQMKCEAIDGFSNGDREGTSAPAASVWSSGARKSANNRGRPDGVARPVVPGPMHVHTCSAPAVSGADLHW